MSSPNTPIRGCVSTCRFGGGHRAWEWDERNERALRFVAERRGVGQRVLDPVPTRERLVRREEIAPKFVQILGLPPDERRLCGGYADAAVQVHGVVEPLLQVRVRELDALGERARCPVGDLAGAAAEHALDLHGVVEQPLDDRLEALVVEVVRQVEEGAVEDDVEEGLHVVFERVGKLGLGQHFGGHELPCALAAAVRLRSL